MFKDAKYVYHQNACVKISHCLFLRYYTSNACYMCVCVCVCVCYCLYLCGGGGCEQIPQQLHICDNIQLFSGLLKQRRLTYSTCIYKLQVQTNCWKCAKLRLIKHDFCVCALFGRTFSSLKRERGWEINVFILIKPTTKMHICVKTMICSWSHLLQKLEHWLKKVRDLSNSARFSSCLLFL